MLYLQKPRMEERQMLYSLEGMWKADLGDGCRYDMKLPGTLETEHHKKAGEEESWKKAGRESFVSEQTVSFGIRESPFFFSGF